MFIRQWHGCKQHSSWPQKQHHHGPHIRAQRRDQAQLFIHGLECHHVVLPVVSVNIGVRKSTARADAPVRCEYMSARHNPLREAVKCGNYAAALSLADAMWFYNPLSGAFTMKKGTRAKPPGTVATRMMYPGDPQSRLVLDCANSTFMAASVAWLMTRGQWPPRVVGFMDGNCHNLAFDNLMVKDAPAAPKRPPVERAPTLRSIHINRDSASRRLATAWPPRKKL